MKRKRLAAILLTAAMMVSAVSTTASAADTVDKYYYKPSISAGEWISTVAHYKETTSEVYVAPDNSPSGYSQMRTYCAMCLAFLPIKLLLEQSDWPMAESMQLTTTCMKMVITRQMKASACICE